MPRVQNSKQLGVGLATILKHVVVTLCERYGRGKMGRGGLALSGADPLLECEWSVAEYLRTVISERLSYG